MRRHVWDAQFVLLQQSVEVRSLARTLFVDLVRGHPEGLANGNSVEVMAMRCWDAAEKFDAEGREREAEEAKSFVPPTPQKETK